MRRVWAVVLAAFLAAPGSAQPTPSCPGDCNLDGIVAINELLLGVNFFLAGLPPSGCDELDDDRDGVLRVNELVLAVVKALGPCRLTDDAAAEAAGQGAVGAADGFDIIDLGSAAAGSGDSGDDAALMGAFSPATTSGTPGRECPAGGTRDETCEIRSGAAQLRVVFDRCASTTDALSIVIDGRMVRTVDDRKFCDTRIIGDGVAVIDAFTDFRQTVQRANQGGPDTVFELSGTFTRRVRFDGSGCAGRNASERFDGDIAFRCSPGGTSAAGCPVEGRDLALTARALSVIRAASGETGACDRIKTLIGRLESQDGISGQRFDAVYRQLVVVSEARLDGTDVQLQGGLALDCLGEVSITTEVPLRRSPAQRCPAAGLLQIRLPDGAEHAVRYRGGGVEIDLDGDGKGDLEAESCEDPGLARCE
jgi:hypothetical protein